MSEKTYLSKEKWKDLKLELYNLETVARKEIAEKLEEARSLGDLSENAEYHEARKQQGDIESRISFLTETLKNAEIFKPCRSSVIEVGSTVSVQKKSDKNIQIYQIVGDDESDISQNKISWKSPLGSAMMGKKEKESFSFETPKGESVNYIIVKVGQN